LDPVTELEGLVDAFEATGVGYAVCGGLALAVHGHPRATMDLVISPSSKAPTMMTQDEIDMSSRAVAARLDKVRALYRLMLYLGKFKPVETGAAQSAERPGQRSRG